MEWPICPFSGEPYTERELLAALIVKAKWPNDVKLRLIRALMEANP